MFGADAAQISFQFENQSQRSKSSRPPDSLDYLFPKFVHPSPWLHKGHNGSTDCLEDFILIAEFSEQEGPRPVIVIPKDGGQNFNQNDFSVKILAVDHQSSIVEGFEMTEDAQVVMTDPETDAHAFIHHIVLNDIQARGYVRPFCISYVTSDPLKIMKCYEEISTQMKKVARLMKYGNRLVFMRDLEKFQEDLSYTKAHLLISQSRTQQSAQGDNDLLNALNTLRQCMEEVKDILSNLKPLLQSDTDLSERFQSYERELKSHRQQHNDDSDSSSLKEFDTREDHFAEKELSGSCTDRTSPIFSLFSKCKNQKPKILDVSTIRGKRRFDRSLRGLHELCSWGAKEGLQKLRAFREFLKRDLASIYVDELDMASLVPDSGVLCFGSNIVGANFLSTFNSPRGVCCSRKKASYCPQHHAGLHSLGSVESFKSFASSFQSFYDDDTMYSAQSSIADTANLGITLNREISVSSEMPEGSDIMDTLYDQEFMFHHDNTIEVNNEFDDTVEGLAENVSSSLVDTLKCEPSAPIPSVAPGSNVAEVDGLSADIPEKFSIDEYYNVDIDRDLVCSAKGCKCDTNSELKDGHKCNNKPEDAERSGNKTENKEGDFNVEKRCNDQLDGADRNGNKTECKESDFNVEKRCNDKLDGAERSGNKTESKESDFNIDECNNKPEGAEGNGNITEYKESDSKVEKCITISGDNVEVGKVGVASDIPVTGSIIPNQNHTCNTGANSETDDKSSIINDDISFDVNHVNVKDISGDDSVTGIKHRGSLSTNESMTGSVSPSKQNIGDVPLDSFLLSARSLDSGLDLPSVRDRHDYSLLNGSQSSFGLSYSGVSSASDNTRKRKWRFLHSSKYLFDGGYTLGQSLQKVIPGYNNLQHVVYSLLSGRPVVVMGTRKQENSLRELVQALSVFVPYTPRAGSVGLLCQSRQMKMLDVHKFQLRGLIRSDKKSVDYLVPKTCRRYVTLVDLEKQQVHCPPYQGILLNFLLSINNKKKIFKSDAALYSYIQLCLEEISNRAFSFYHRVTSGDCDMNIHGSSVLHKTVMLEASYEKYLGEAGIRNSDCKIIKHLAEVVKIQQIDEEFKSKYLTDAPAYPFSITYQTIQTFKL